MEVKMCLCSHKNDLALLPMRRVPVSKDVFPQSTPVPIIIGIYGTGGGGGGFYCCAKYAILY
jgi:hypothetical protein